MVFWMLVLLLHVAGVWQAVLTWGWVIQGEIIPMLPLPLAQTTWRLLCVVEDGFSR